MLSNSVVSGFTSLYCLCRQKVTKNCQPDKKSVVQTIALEDRTDIISTNFVRKRLNS